MCHSHPSILPRRRLTARSRRYSTIPEYAALLGQLTASMVPFALSSVYFLKERRVIIAEVMTRWPADQE